ncbi:Uncharacterised protein [Vibrio cholerae]|nr:Uncharacterised protein [Vibrio cholerae]
MARSDTSDNPSLIPRIFKVLMTPNRINNRSINTKPAIMRCTIDKPMNLSS